MSLPGDGSSDTRDITTGKPERSSAPNPTRTAEAGSAGNTSRANHRLEVPLQRSFRPSLDSTYSELSELSAFSSPRNGHLPEPSPPAAPGEREPALRKFWVRNKGVILVLASQFFGSGMNVSTRILETDGSHGKAMHPFQVLFARMSITLALSLLYGYRVGSIPHFPFGPKVVRGLLISRGLGGFFGVFGLYFSLLYLPLSEATVLTFLGPILTCYACSFFIPGEAFSRQQQMAGYLSLVGVILIARPGSLFSSDASTPHDGDVPSNHTNSPSSSLPSSFTPNPPPATPHQHLLAIMVSMLGVLGAAIAMTSIRAIGNRAHPLISINYFSLWCTIVSLFAVTFAPTVGFRLPGNVAEWALLALLGSFGFVMQVLLTAGLAYGGPGSGGKQNISNQHATDRPHLPQADLESADVEAGDQVNTQKFTTKPGKGSGSRATSMMYTQMLFALLFDKLIWDISPGVMSWAGSGIILGCAVWVAAARESPGTKEGKRADGSIPEHTTSRRRKEERSNGLSEEGIGLMEDVGDEEDDNNVEMHDLDRHDRSEASRA